MIVKTEQVVIVLEERLGADFFTRKMIKVLERQGQIEPLQVRIHHINADGTATYETFKEDAWAGDIVTAARKLGWPTILIAVVDRFEE